MENYSDIPGSLRIPHQAELDAKKTIINEAALKNLGSQDNLAYTYGEGIQIYCQEEKTRWEWKEAIGELQGLLPLDFTYPDGWIGDGIDYSLKSFNFFPVLSYLNLEDKLDKDGYTGTAKDLDNEIQNLKKPNIVLRNITPTIVGLNISAPADSFEWRINQVVFDNTPALAKTLRAASVGFYRKDALLGTDTNSYLIVEGIEGDESVISPSVFPEGTILLGTIDVFGDSATGFLVNDTSKVSVFGNGGDTDYVEVNKLGSTFDIRNATSLTGFTIPSSNIQYGKDYYIRNSTGGNLTLKSIIGRNNIRFYFPDGDLVVPLNNNVHLKYLSNSEFGGLGYLTLVGIDYRNKVDKVLGYTLTKNDLSDILKANYDNTVNWISTNGDNLINHISRTDNPHGVTALQVGAPSGSGTSIGTNTGDDTAQSIISKIGDGIKINQSYLPSYVDDILEFDTFSLFPIVGEIGKIYIVTTGADINKQYRWTGSLYTQITNGLIASTNDVPEGVNNLYFTVARFLANLTSINVKSALGYTPEDVANKQNSLAVDGTGVKFPTVDATNAGLSTKVTSAGTTNYIQKSTGTGTQGNSSLVDNDTSVQGSLPLTISGAITGTTIVKAGATATNILLAGGADITQASLPVSTATQTALNLKANLASPTFTGVPLVPTATAGTNTLQAASTAFVAGADAGNVKLTGSQTIAGTKTFSSSINGSINGSWNSNGLCFQTIPSGAGGFIGINLTNNADQNTSHNSIRITGNTVANLLDISNNGTGQLWIGRNNGIATSFISKEGTFTGTSFVNSSAPATNALLANGTTLANPISGIGTTGYLPKFTSAGVIGNSQVFDNGTNVGIGAVNPTEKLEVVGNVLATQYKISALNTAPASATATGTTGEIRITAGFIYVCTATNTWVRTALATW